MIPELPMPARGKILELLPLHQAVIRVDDSFSLGLFSLIVDELSLVYDITRDGTSAVVADAARSPITITSSQHDYVLRISPAVYATVTNATRANVNVLSFATPKQIKHAKMTDLIDQGYFASETGSGGLYSYLSVRPHQLERLDDKHAFEHFVQVFAITWNNFAVARINEYKEIN